MSRTLRVALLSVNEGVSSSIMAACRDIAEFTLFRKPDEFDLAKVTRMDPDVVFVPHWRWKIGGEVLSTWPCIGFHASPLPRGRGGSPIQNQIAAGQYDSEVCAFLLTAQMDAGPVLLRRRLDLSEGSLDEIFARIAREVSKMAVSILSSPIEPVPQEGPATYFSRRSPDQSLLDIDSMSPRQLFDHIRMLDGLDYPRAYLDLGEWNLILTKASMENSDVVAEVRFVRKAQGH